ncbi:hypothetical protein [Aliamphritea hakodatensis]|uniref:hypothetical protein n=1 Tax=Aliamphritea hakodatensis TaxID=2895352 RepID=UPI0022FD45D5|nr:hypothetical protein [Aliamphritea hakodatensis]
MSENTELNEVEAKQGEVITKEQSASELEAITALLQGVVTPFAKAQEVSEQEATKRAGIIAGVANKAILALFGVAFFVLLLAAYAVSQGNESMAEKMVIALLAFFGGLGAGKATSNK